LGGQSVHTLNDRQAMKASSKVILVVAGYLAALVIAFVVVSLYIAAPNGPDRQTYSGMFAFGDSILFLGVFAIAAIPASGAALFFLRPYPTLWRMASVGALAIATTGVAALAAYLMSPNVSRGTWLWAWSGLSPLRFLLAPPLAMAFFLYMLFAPTRASRVALLGASVIETIVFVWVALIWFHPFQ
jgi:energy-converting hydrogenase Eha subunit A